MARKGKKTRVKAHKRAKPGGKSKSVKVKGYSRKPGIVKRARYQTPVTSKRTSPGRDRARKALPPGRRRSKSGRIYTETRVNRSDKNQRKRY